MHCLTSSIFLPSIANLLSAGDRVILLRSYVLAILHMTLCRGRPHIFPETIMQHTPFPAPPGAGVIGTGLQIVGDPSEPTGGNPWLALVSSAMYAQGEPRVSYRLRISFLTSLQTPTSSSRSARYSITRHCTDSMPPAPCSAHTSPTQRSFLVLASLVATFSNEQQG
jgi:hypothetical protein